MTIFLYSVNFFPLGIRNELWLKKKCVFKKLACSFFNTIEHFFFSFTVKPIKMELKGPPMPVRQNASVTLSCNIHQAKPAANVTWFNGSIPLDRRDNKIVDEENRRVRTYYTLLYHSNNSRSTPKTNPSIIIHRFVKIIRYKTEEIAYIKRKMKVVGVNVKDRHVEVYRCKYS